MMVQTVRKLWMWGLLLGLGTLLQGWGLQTAQAQSWYVDKNNPQAGNGDGTLQNPFKTISDAVQAANAWGANPINTDRDKTIFVAPGTYTGEQFMDIRVSKLLITGDPNTGNNRGPGANAPIIDGGTVNNIYCFSIGSGLDSITIEGFYFRNYNGVPDPDFTRANAPGCVTGGSLNGTGINAVNTSTSPIEALTIRYNQFENMGAAIFLTAPGCGTTPLNYSLGGVFEGLRIEHNIIDCPGTATHGILVENGNNALIDNNLIEGNPANSSDYGLEIGVRNNSGAYNTGGAFPSGCNGNCDPINAGDVPLVLTIQNITVTNNDFLYHESNNLLVGFRRNVPNTTIRNVVIQNNRFTNNNLKDQGDGGRLLLLNGGYSDFNQGTGGCERGCAVIEDVSVLENSFTYLVNNGSITFVREAPDPAFRNMAVWIRNIAGDNVFNRNTFDSEYDPIGLTVNGGSGNFHGIAVDNGINSRVGNWEFRQNVLDGHNVNKPNDYSSGVWFNDCDNPTTRFIVEENVIRNFVSAVGTRVGSITNQQISSIQVSGNNLEGNVIGVANFTNGHYTGGNEAANIQQGVIDASFNWWGNTNSTVVADYVDGAQRFNAAGTVLIAATPDFAGVPTPLSTKPNVDFTPWLDSGVDSDPNTPGFQPSYDYLHIDRYSPQSPQVVGVTVSDNGNVSPEVGTNGRIGEALERLPDGGTIYVYDRGLNSYYNEGFNNTITKNVIFDSDGAPIVDNLRMATPLSSDMLTLRSPLRINRSLSLQKGKIDIGNFDLTVLCYPITSTVPPIISGGSDSSYVLTNGTGTLARDCMGGDITTNAIGFTAPVTYPVGTDRYYAPATIANTETNTDLSPDRFSVRVTDQVYDPPGSFTNQLNTTVGTTWWINEACPNSVSPCIYDPSVPAPGRTNTFLSNNVTLSLQWPSSQEGSAFNRQGSYIREYTSSGWVAVPGTSGGVAAPPTGGDPFVRTAQNQTGVFINKAFAVFSDCPSPPVVPSTVARCDAGTLTFTMAFGPPTNPPVTPDRMVVYEQETGGAPIAAYTTSPATFTTPSLALGETREYWVATEVLNGCQSVRQKVTVSAAGSPSDPVVDNSLLQRCGSGMVTYTVRMGANPGNVVHLVSDPNNPTNSIIASDNTANADGTYNLTTPMITTNTSYGIFIETQASNTSCQSNAVAVQALVNPRPGAPTASEVVNCGGGTVTITAVMGNPMGTEIRLFTQAFGGSPVAVDNTQPYELSANAPQSLTWFLESFSSTTGCPSETRTPVNVTITNETLGPPVINSNVRRCAAGTVTLSVNPGNPPGNQYRVYTAAAAGTMLAEMMAVPAATTQIPVQVTTTTTLYVASRNTATGCESAPRVPVTVNVDPLPGLPFVTDVSRCGAGAVVFTAQMGNPAGTEMRLFSQATGGTALNISRLGPNFEISTPVTDSTTTYYIASANPSCESNRAAAVANINLTGDPVVEDVYLCEPGVATFMPMMGDPAGTEIRMYDAPAGGTLLQSDPLAPFAFATSSTITTNTTYWFTVFNSTTGCETERREAVVRVNDFINPPVSVSSRITRCGPGAVTVSVSLTSQNGGNAARLFTTATGGSPVAVDDTFPYNLTANATESTTWYVESFNTATQCSSQARLPVLVVLEDFPGTPSVANLRRCGEGVATFSALMGSPRGSELRLYISPVSNTPVASDPFPPYLLQTPGNTQPVTTYFMSSYNAALQCESTRIPVTVTLDSLPQAPDAEDVARCGSGVITLTVDMDDTGADEAYLFTSQSGGVMLGRVIEDPYTLNTPPLNNSTNFYLEARNSQTGCVSPNRTVVTGIVHANPGRPQVSAVRRCEAGTATFSVVMGAPPGDVVQLYDSETGTNVLATDSQPPYLLTSPFTSTTTTYFINVMNSTTGCMSERAAAMLMVNANPAPPSAENVVRCQSGTVVITAQMGSPAGNQIEVFSQSVGGPVLVSDNTTPFQLTTPSINTTTTFFLEAVDDQTGCRSGTRTLVTATVNTQRPALPQVDDVSRCGSGPAMLTVAPGFPGGSEIRLYQTQGGGQPIATSTDFPAMLETPQVNANTTFYVSVFDAFTGCEGDRQPVEVEVLTAPGAPNVDNVARCGVGTLTFTAFTSAPAGDEIRVYAQEMGGAPILTDNQPPFEISTGFLGGTTSYYLTAYSSSTGCESLSRTVAVATVNPIPAAPTAENRSVCGSGASVTFEAVMGNPAGTEARLYTQSQGGAPIATALGAPFQLNTPTVSATRVFYLEAANSNTGCISASRNPVVAVFNSTPPPDAPFVNDVSRCGPGVATITASLTTLGVNSVRLYNAEQGGQLLASAFQVPYQLNTPSISTTSTFYVASVASSGCESSRTPVEVSVNPVPSEPMAMDVNICQAGPAQISVTFGDVPGNIVRLYGSETSTNSLDSDNTVPFELTTPSVDGQRTFYIEAGDAQSGCLSARTRVDVNLVTPPSLPVAEDVDRCGGGMATLTVFQGNVAGDEIRLYETSGSTTPLRQDMDAPFQLSVPQVFQTTTYYVESYSSQTGCNSPRLAVEVRVNSIPGQPVVEDVARCGIGTVTFTGLLTQPTGSQIRLYASDFGGQPIATDNRAPYELAIPNVSVTTEFFAASFDEVTGCESNRVTAQAIVNPTISTPAAGEASRCGPGTVSITPLNVSPDADEVRIYASSSGGAVVATSRITPYILRTPRLSTSTRYFIEAANTVTGCTSPRTGFNVTINTVPGQPDAEQPSVCGSGSVTFSVQMGQPLGNEIRLYETDQGGTPLAVATNSPYTLTTPSISQTRTYYVGSASSVSGCESLLQPVVVRVEPIPGQPFAPEVSRCGTGAVTFTASMGTPAGTQIRLYDTRTGGVVLDVDESPAFQLTAQNVGFSRTYYLESHHAQTGCTSQRASVQVSVNPAVGQPTVFDVRRCGTGSVAFSVQQGNPAGNVVRLYSSASAVTPLDSDAASPYELTTPTIGTSTNYFISSFNAANNCESQRVQVLAVVDTETGVPDVADVSRCASGVVTFTASNGFPPATEIRMYTQRLGGSPVAVDANEPFELTTGVVNADATYYFEGFNTQTGCVSDRIEAVARINEVPSAPNADHVNRCGPGEVVFTAFFGQVPGNEIRMYDAPSGGTQLVADGTFPYELNTGERTFSSTFHLEAYNSETGCTSSGRTSVQAQITLPPGQPEVSDQVLCGGGTAVLQASMAGVAGDEMRLYSSPVGGVPLSVDPNPPYQLETPTLNATETFYAASANGNCEGPRSPVTVEVVDVPSVPFVQNITRCGGGAVSLTVLPGFVEADRYRMYNAAFNGSIVAETRQPPFELLIGDIQTTTTYYVAGINEHANGSCESPRASVVVTVEPAVVRPSVSSISRCGSGEVIFTVNGIEPGQEARLYSEADAATPVNFVAENPALLSAGVVNSTTTFYISRASGNCESERVPVSVSINPQPLVPSALSVRRCGPGRVTVTAIAGVGSSLDISIQLYENQQGGRVLAQAVQPPYVLNLSNVAESREYFVSALSGNCESNRTPVSVTVDDIPQAPVVPDVQRCGPGVVTFTADPGNEFDTEVRLFSTPTGGSPVSVSFTFPYELTTPPVSLNAVYYVSSRTGDCESARTRVRAQVANVPTEPIANNIGSCTNRNLTLTAFMGSTPGNEIRFYDVNGNLLAVDPTSPYLYDSGPLSETTTFFVASATGNCESPRRAVEVTAGAAPTVPFAEAVERCGSGAVVFSPSMSVVMGNEVRLYDAPVGGNLVAVSGQAPFRLTVPSVSTTTTYYLSSALNDGQTVCESPRAPVPAIILAAPPSAPRISPVTRCGAGTVEFTLQGVGNSDELRLYSQSNGGTPLRTVGGNTERLISPVVQTATTYYIASASGDCESNRVPAVAGIIEQPASPTAENLTLCGQGTAVFTLQPGAPAGQQLRLYNAQTDETPVATLNTPPYTVRIPNLSSTTDYFISSVNFGASGICESPRIQVTANVVNTPAAPRSLTAARCGAGSVSLNFGSGTDGNTTLRLYDSVAGGNLVAVDARAPFVVELENVQETTTFYASYGTDACESSRVPVTVNVSPGPEVPAVSDVFRCGNGPVVFTAQPIGNTADLRVELFASQNAAAPVAVATSAPYTLTTPSLRTTTTYYLRTTRNNCSSPRVPVVAGVELTPTLPFAEDISTCGNGPITFTMLSGGILGTEYRLYDTPSGGQPLATAPVTSQTLTLPNPSPGTYFLAMGTDLCESGRVSVQYTRGAELQLAVQVQDAGCGGAGSITADAAGGTGGITYELLQGQNVVAINGSGQFTNLAAGSYTLRASDSEGCNGTAAAVVQDQLPTPTLAPVTELAPTQARANWPAIGGAVGYVLEYRPVGTADFTRVEVASNNSSTLLTGLMPGTAYELRLQARCSGGQSTAFSSLLRVTTPTQACGIPENVRVLADTTRATVLWGEVPGAVSYTLRYRSLPNGNFQTESNLTTTRLELTGLQPATGYEVQVQTNCGGAASSFSPAQSFTTQGTPVVTCSEPNIVEAAPGVTDSDINWTAVAEAQSYTLRYRLLPTGSFTEINNLTALRTTLTGLLADTTYEVSVRTRCANGVSTFTTPVTFRTQPGGGAGVCDTPTELQIGSATPNGPVLTWTPNEGGVTCYLVNYGPVDQPTSQWTTAFVPHPGASIELTNLIAGTEYGARIRSNCDRCSATNGVLTPWSDQVIFLTQTQREAQATQDQELKWQVYPNPSTGWVTVDMELPRAGSIQLEIRDLTGRVVHTQVAEADAGSWTQRIDLRDWPSGVYGCSWRYEGTRHTTKLIKQ